MKPGADTAKPLRGWARAIRRPVAVDSERTNRPSIALSSGGAWLCEPLVSTWGIVEITGPPFGIPVLVLSLGEASPCEPLVSNLGTPAKPYFRVGDPWLLVALSFTVGPWQPSLLHPTDRTKNLCIHPNNFFNTRHFTQNYPEIPALYPDLSINPSQCPEFPIPNLIDPFSADWRPDGQSQHLHRTLYPARF